MAVDNTATAYTVALAHGFDNWLESTFFVILVSNKAGIKYNNPYNTNAAHKNTKLVLFSAKIKWKSMVFATKNSSTK